MCRCAVALRRRRHRHRKCKIGNEQANVLLTGIPVGRAWRQARTITRARSSSLNLRASISRPEVRVACCSSFHRTLFSALVRRLLMMTIITLLRTSPLLDLLLAAAFGRVPSQRTDGRTIGCTSSLGVRGIDFTCGLVCAADAIGRLKKQAKPLYAIQLAGSRII